MSEKDKKIIKAFLWGIGMILTIFITCYISSSNTAKPKSVPAHKNESIVVHDGSENNPVIQGVQ